MRLPTLHKIIRIGENNHHFEFTQLRENKEGHTSISLKVKMDGKKFGTIHRRWNGYWWMDEPVAKEIVKAIGDELEMNMELLIKKMRSGK